jgi:DNA-binding Lrp family transcriptional regulator
LRGRGETLQMDPVDQRIIAHLSTDARASYAEIGAQVALSAPAVKRRVDRLRATGVIKGFTAVIDPASIGWTTEPFVTSTRSMIVLSRLVDDASARGTAARPDTSKET